MARVVAAPDMVRLVREQAGINPEELTARFKMLPAGSPGRGGADRAVTG